MSRFSSKNIGKKNILNFYYNDIYLNLTYIVFGLSLLTILIGPYVRAEDAGLACPDWPLCHGYVIPPLDYQIYLEFMHRVVAAILGIFFILWFVLGIIYIHLRNRFLPYLILTGFVLAVQIVLGRETITRQLNAYVVKFHLLNAIFFVSIIFYILWELRYTKIKSLLTIPLNKNSSGSTSSFLFLLFIFLFCVYFQIFLGGRVSANYVGLVCNEFPECYQEFQKIVNKEIIQNIYFPPLIYGFEMHLSHRFMGYFLLIYAIFLLWFSYKQNLFFKKMFFIFSLLFFQICLGIINIIFELPTLTRVIHSFTATILFLSILNLIFYIKKTQYN